MKSQIIHICKQYLNVRESDNIYYFIDYIKCLYVSRFYKSALSGIWSGWVNMINF